MTEQMNNNNLDKEKEAVNTLIDGLTLFDDDLMSRVFDKNIEATELVLRIILGRNIKVLSVDGQDEMRNHEVGGRNITLDVHAIDVNGEEIDIEVQGNSEGAHIRRARFHSSMVDSRMLGEGKKFKELKDSYVIFIYKHDKFSKGLPLYHIDRYVRETKELFDDGSHIIYVNGNYKGNDEIGQLMKDFHQTDPENMHYDALAQGVKHFKETEEGRESMCEAVEKYGDERAIKANVKSVKNLMENMKLTLDQALNALGIQGDERELITKQLQK
ncbi:MAG: PD-(D/E)XK nuclease family transposase [Agathobacter sp.]|nr:PD-(D/E)XK nuclease family transposase [Agathobacter sp.]